MATNLLSQVLGTNIEQEVLLIGYDFLVAHYKTIRTEKTSRNILTLLYRVNLD